MPKIVDHDERRREVLSAASRVIVRDGIDAATTRAIAKEAGYSNGVLAHYFADKDEILLSALRHSHRRIRGRLTGKVAGMTGLAALREVLLDNLPLDAERWEETRLEVSFWSRSLASERLAEVQRAEAGELRAAVRELLEQARTAGELSTDDDLDDVAERLLALVDGLSLHLLLYPDRMGRDVAERLMTQAVERL
ncbi:Transcriptional regulator, TetR family [[Actinomadura] parvosata subsp. kistnae]|uniref:Transcriptional regulator n=1 Tax=[Actinomadura] parvosata subsp. kistnae TaxID=1909395 RepID=A0A1V0AGH2_9ACTN|nr:TetR/AcrR family transcriptional regulator [Nonomuraea sp. ATCC 55076]AQZ69317.1 transcriptional regulator [Nonomuraea sp. ATCC 55076]SPL92049.1 Transcriptional regulator, TetR family [Actinomadura parvosata subsp. kistnae]